MSRTNCYYDVLYRVYCEARIKIECVYFWTIQYQAIKYKCIQTSMFKLQINYLKNKK